VNAKYRVLALMTGAQAGAAVVQQAVGVLAPFLIAQFAVNQTQIGALFTALFLGAMCFTAVSGALTDRFGERTMVAVSGGLMTLALVAAVIVPNYTWLVAWMAVFGAGYAASTPAGGRAILTWFDRDRGFAMGVRQTGVPIGGFVGALVLPLAALNLGGYRAALLVAAVLVALPTALAVIAYRPVPGERPMDSHLRDVLRGMGELIRDPRMIAVTLTSTALVNVQLAMNGFFTLTAIHVVGVTPAIAASAFAGAFAAAAVARLFWGWYSDRFMRHNRVVLLAVLCALAAVGSVVMALLRPPLATLLIPTALFLGFCGVGWNGVMAAALAEIGGADRAGSALGLTLTAVFASSAVSPLVFGAIADHTSLGVAWMVTAAVGVAGVAPVLWLRSHMRRSG
jgi:MFS family permease